MSITPIRAMDFSGKAYIVMDTFNKTVLEAKNEHYVQSVASISKIMTAIVAIENGNLDDEYEIKSLNNKKEVSINNEANI